MNNKQHLIAIDLDGTLLRDDKTISDTSKQVLAHLIELGHTVIIATGRSNRMSHYYYHELKLTTPLINSNGAVLHHPHNKKWGNFHYPVDNKTALEIVDLSYQLKMKNIVATDNDMVYLDRYDVDIISYLDQAQDKTDDGFIVGNIKDELKIDPTLLMIYPDERESTMDIFTKELDGLHTEIIEHRNWGAPFNIIEIMSKGINKASAIKQVAEELSIPKDRVIAFGDEGNDLAMIDYAGMGVAMGNANPELKSIANYVTDTNENDGVANYLKGYFDLKI